MARGLGFLAQVRALLGDSPEHAGTVDPGPGSHPPGDF